MAPPSHKLTIIDLVPLSVPLSQPTDHLKRYLPRCPSWSCGGQSPHPRQALGQAFTPGLQPSANSSRTQWVSHRSGHQHHPWDWANTGPLLSPLKSSGSGAWGGSFPTTCISDKLASGTAVEDLGTPTPLKWRDYYTYLTKKEMEIL